MTTQYKNILLILISLLVAGNFLQAQGIYNVFTNKEIKFDNDFYKDVYSKNPIFKTKVEIRSFKLKEDGSKIIKKINEQSYNLCNDYISKESQSLMLYKELKMKLEVYNQMVNSRNDSYRKDGCSISMFQLEEVESEVISTVDNKLFIKVNLSFKSQYPRNSYDDAINIDHYYIADLRTGTIKRWSNKLSSSEVKIIQNKISKRLNETYSNVEAEEKYTALKVLENTRGRGYGHYEEENTNDTVNNEENVALRVYLKEADIYWFAWGIIIGFQEYTNSSEIYYGSPFQMFIPWDEAKEIFSSIAGFSFLNKLYQPQTEIRNFNKNEMIKNTIVYEKVPDFMDVLKINPLTIAPKTLLIESRQIAENGYTSYRNKIELEFNEKAKILQKITFKDSINISNKEFFVYDNKANIIRTSRVNYRNQETIKEFIYSKQNNLIQMNNINSSNPESHYYFYNANKTYTFSLSMPFEINKYTVSCFEQKKNEYSTNSIIYILNDEGNVIGKNSHASSTYMGQVGRDSLGRIVESHSERDRYNHYWDYDENGRIVSYQFYEYQNVKKEKVFYYKDNSSLPYKCVESFYSSYNSSKKRLVTYSYNWGF